MKIKRFPASGGALRAAVFAAALAALAGCSNTGGDGAPSLVSISVKAAATVCVQGQDLDLSAITVTGTYSDGSEKPFAPADLAVAGYDKTKPGTQTLTVTAGGQSATFTVTVTDDPGEAKTILSEAVDRALNNIEGIAVSQSESSVPQGVPWVKPAQKAELDKAVADARKLAASDNASLAKIVAALEDLQDAVEKVTAAAETQTGTKTDWSYTVSFNNNGGAGTDPEAKTAATPATTVGSLPAAPTRSGFVFSGWNTSANGSGSVFTEATPLAADLTVYAQWTLIVNARAPSIASQPRGGTFNAGSTVTLSVTASSPDGGTLSYQWHSRADSGGEWTAIADAAGPSYNPPSDTAGTLYYYVKITNTNNSLNGTTSASTDSGEAAVTITVVDALAPAISVQPRGGTFSAGSTVTLTVTASSPDGGTLSYQWHSGAGGESEWTAIEGATGASYSPSASGAGTLSYYVKVTNTNNDLSGAKTASTDSMVAVVIITAVNAGAPLISAQPQDGTHTVGSAAAPLTVTASSPDGGTLSYQWHSGSAAGGPWTAIEGATGASHTPLTDTAGTFYYYVKITNTNNNVNGIKTASTDSREAAVAITVVDAQAPAISVQPRSATYARNEQPAALTVAAASPDAGTLSYQWQSGANSGGPWTAISGATGTSYTPPSSAEYQTVYYRVTITNTNNNVSGAKTAVTDSGEAAVIVAPLNAAAAVISVHPQSASYNQGGAAAALTVTASSPDGGTLSYQWQSRAGVNGPWTDIPGAIGTSSTPSTAVAGSVYYRVEVTNTNTAANIDGNTATTTRSREAKIMIELGTLNLSFEVWVNDDRSLISNMPANLRVSRASQGSLAITAAADLTGLQWSINGADLTGSRGSAQTIVIEAANYGAGTYTLGLSAVKDAAPYSINIAFTVVD